MKSFSELQKEKNLTSTNFPYTITSLFFLKRLKSMLFPIILFQVGRYILNRYTDILFYYPTVDNYLLLVLKILYVVSFVLAIIYLYFVVLRQRLFERSVIINDIRALRLKQKIIQYMNLEVDIQRVSETINKAKKQHSQDNASNIARAKIDLEAYESLQDMVVTINRREKSDGNVETVYNIFIEPPKSTSASVTAKKIADDRVAEAGRKAMKGIYFGERRISNIETDEFFFQAVADVKKNQWNYDDEIERLQTLKDSTYYQHTMPYKETVIDGISYHGFTDNNKINDERRSKGEEWAKGKIDDIERILANESIGAKFNNLKLMSRTAEFTFTIPILKFRGDSKSRKFDEISLVIDENIDCNGTRITSKLNELYLSLPLPNGLGRDGVTKTEDYCLLLNNEDFFRKAFG